jgi:ParB family chromosome partitioning protein
MQVLTSSETEEWYTPHYIIEMVRGVLGDIELDPATCALAQGWIKAERYYTIADNGLWQDWNARTLFLNPPYGKTGTQSNQMVWMAKLLDSLPTIGSCVALTKTVPGYIWWDSLFNDCWPGPVCITRGRLCFVDSSGLLRGQSKAASSFWYYGEYPERFSSIFSKIGKVI